MAKTDWKALLADDGPIAQAISGFQVRPQQQAMLEAVSEAIETNSSVVIEAGTGVGKTFAYLLPAFLSGGKVIVSTGSKTLQDQLFLKDLPLVKKALKSGAQTALLKGRANYLCKHRLRLVQLEGRFKDKKSISHLRRIDDWAFTTQSGDVAELITVPRDAEIWPSVTSTTDNCLAPNVAIIRNAMSLLPVAMRKRPILWWLIITCFLLIWH